MDELIVVAKRQAKGLEGEELSSVAGIFRALSDPTRLRILSLVGAGESCVHELCAETAMSQPAVSHQLRLLRAYGMVRARRVGREVYYAIDDAHVLALVAQARSHAGHVGQTSRETPRVGRVHRAAAAVTPPLRRR